jgi:hypothetical protein
MPGRKIGRLWKFDRKEVDAWVKSGAAGDSRIDDSGKAEKR